MKDELMDMLKFGLFAGIVFVVVLTVLLTTMSLVSIPYEIGQCNTLQELDSGNQYQWVFWGGCLTKMPNGRWVDADDYFDYLYIEKGE